MDHGEKDICVLLSGTWCYRHQLCPGDVVQEEFLYDTHWWHEFLLMNDPNGGGDED